PPPQEMSQLLVEHTTHYVQTHLGGWHTIAAAQDFGLVVQGQVYLIHIEPWRGEAGLDWLAVVVVPESNYLAEINQNIRRTVILSGGTILVSLVFGVGIVQLLINSIQRLNTSVVAIANGNLNHTVARSRIHELDVFSQSFNQMAIRLQQSFVQLTQTKAELEQTVTLRTAELETLNQELQYLSVTDELTQLPNRRAFNQRLAIFNQLGQPRGMSLSLIMTDIDYFKPYNDFYGHLQGDRCIQQVAEILQGLGYRSTDMVARYGGEEFAIILPETDLAGAMAVAQRCQEALQQAQIPHARSSVSAWVTMSFGIAYLPSHAIASPDQLIQMADVALYQAKKEGRNSIQCYYGSPDSLAKSGNNSGELEDRVTGSGEIFRI
ncbi:MAG: diguanylate cyclase, partial [Leptolyngbyaceae bacterium]|nr:diguanylate cyclase [Leptolyngbyaceae bacterium]